MLKAGQKFTNLDFFLHQRPQTKPSSLRGSTRGGATSSVPITHRSRPSQKLPLLLAAHSTRHRELRSCKELQETRPALTSTSWLAALRPAAYRGLCTELGKHRNGASTAGSHTPIEQRGLAMSCVLRGFLIFKLLGAGQPRPDFGGDLEHGSHDAGTWQQGAGLQLGAAHTMAASQQERSEDAATCSRGRKPPAAPSALPKAGETQLWVFLLQP